jgi:signal transduction histidine kinase
LTFIYDTLMKIDLIKKTKALLLISALSIAYSILAVLSSLILMIVYGKCVDSVTDYVTSIVNNSLEIMILSAYFWFKRFTYRDMDRSDPALLMIIMNKSERISMYFESSLTLIIAVNSMTSISETYSWVSTEKFNNYLIIVTVMTFFWQLNLIMFFTTIEIEIKALNDDPVADIALEDHQALEV